MPFRIVEDDEKVSVVLTGWDRIMCWRRRVEFPHDQITSATLARRGDLEPSIDGRFYGFGPHDAAKRPGWRRVGAMAGRHVRGMQFWAVGKGGPEAVLVVLDLHGHEFARAVLAVTDADRSVERIRAGR